MLTRMLTHMLTHVLTHTCSQIYTHINTRKLAQIQTRPPPPTHSDEIPTCAEFPRTGSGFSTTVADPWQLCCEQLLALETFEAAGEEQAMQEQASAEF